MQKQIGLFYQRLFFLGRKIKSHPKVLFERLLFTKNLFIQKVINICLATKELFQGIVDTVVSFFVTLRKRIIFYFHKKYFSIKTNLSLTKATLKYKNTEFLKKIDDGENYKDPFTSFRIKRGLFLRKKREALHLSYFNAYLATGVKNIEDIESGNEIFGKEIEEKLINYYNEIEVKRSAKIKDKNLVKLRS